jgi:hypothetical protein
VTEADDEDEQLKSLRAVWLSLPDEDPPERGLSELMAAARAKATEMSRPAVVPWWRRLFEQIKRPPVLALATITVLIGGAVLVTSRKDEMEVKDTAPVPPPAEPKVEQPPPLPTVATPPIEAPSGGSKNSEATDGMDQAAPKHEKPEPPKPVVRHVTKKPPATKSTPPPVVTKTKTETTKAPVAEPSRDKGDDAKMQIADPHAGAIAPGADSEETTTRGPQAKTQAPAITQLLSACRAAAARGDCAQVRSLAKRIASEDATYYRSNVANDTAITKCLASE